MLIPVIKPNHADNSTNWAGVWYRNIIPRVYTNPRPDRPVNRFGMKASRVTTCYDNPSGGVKRKQRDAHQFCYQWVKSSY